MAYFEEMDVGPYDEDEFFINLGLYPGGVFNETPGTRALQSLPSILGQIAGRASEMGRDYEDEDYIYRPIYETPEGTIEMQGPMHTIPVLLEQEVGGGGAPRMPTTTTTTPVTDDAASSDDNMRTNNTTSGSIYGQALPGEGGRGRGVRQIEIGGQIIQIPEGKTPLQHVGELFTKGLLTRELYDEFINRPSRTSLPNAGEAVTDPSLLSPGAGDDSLVVDTTGTGQVTDTTGTGDVTGSTDATGTGDVTTGNLTTGDVTTSLQGGDTTVSTGDTSFTGGDLYGGDVTTGDTSLTTGATTLTGGDVTTGDVLTDVISEGGQGGTGGIGYGGTGQGGAGGAGGTGTGGTASVVFNPYQPTLSPFELGEYGRLIPSTQSGVLPELADFMNYYGASVPGMTQQMADVTGAGQTAFARQLLGMEGDRISTFDIAQEASRQQRGALGDVFGLGPDATYADITAAGTAPMEALSQVRGTVLPGLESAFQTAQERLEKGLTGRERQQVEQATRARFGALGRGADTAALATEIGDIMQEERGLYSRNLQDLLGIGQTTGALIGQEAYAMSPFTQAAIGAADLGPGLALAGDIGRQAAAATPSPTDLFGLEAGERQFGLDLEALDAAASAGDLNVVSSLLGTIGSAFRGGPYAGLQQQNLGTPTYTGMPIGQSFNPFGFNLRGF